MPELPEVETVVRDLRPLLVGRRIRAVARPTGHDLRTPWSPDWDRAVAGRSVTHLGRRGKWILGDLDAGHLVLHLGMTGQLRVHPRDEPLADHTHLVFDLDGGDQLRFRDTRRFGSATLFADAGALSAFLDEQGLGPEPWELDPKAWRASLSATTRAIKAVLLDQGVVAGVGNIYADEALFEAKLHPARRACDLTTRQANRLLAAIVTVLERAIERGGSTIRDYVGGAGQPGEYQEEFRAYDRTGEPCSRCRSAIESVRLAGRSTHFCPRCQPAGATTGSDG